MHTAADVILWAIVVFGSALFALAAQPKTRTLLFAAGVIFFLGGMLAGGYWLPG